MINTSRDHALQDDGGNVTICGKVFGGIGKEEA